MASAPAAFTGSCWPGPTEQLLLRAALLDDPEATAAWREWLAGDRLESAHVSERRLLPPVYRNLMRLEADGPEMGRLRGIHRHDWYRNQLLFDAASRLITVLEEAGIRTMVLKGAALAVLHYRDAGSRTMGDVDVLVPQGEAARAIEVAAAAGWGPDPAAPAGLLGTFHAWTYSNGEGGLVDLHWRAFAYSRADESDLWDNTVPLELSGVPTRAMGPADELVHVLVHGLEWNPVSPIRWIPDAVSVIRSQDGDIDWQRFSSLVTRHGFSASAAELLAYLRANFTGQVPAAVVERLRATPSSRRERRLQSALVGRPHRLRRSLRIHWAAYRALHPPAERGDGRIGFARFVATRWRLGGIRDLPRFVLHKLSLRLR
jgi:hypothetical protein